MLFISLYKKKVTDIVLDLGYLGALVRIVCERVSDSDGPSLLSEKTKKILINALLNKDTGTSTACLALIPAATGP